MNFAHPLYWLHRCFSWLNKAPQVWLYTIFGWAFFLQLILHGFVLAFLSMVKPDKSHTPGWAKQTHDFLSEHSFSLFCIFLCVEAVTAMGRWTIRKLEDPWRANKRLINKVLDELVSDHFDVDNEETYRATLFKAYGPFLFVGGWLSVVVRSGEAYSSSKAVFSIHKSREDRNTGLAGQCWWRAAQQKKDPWIRRLDGDNLDNLIKNRVTLNELNAINVKAQFFNTVAIIKEGRIWGVLVLDSTDPALLGTDEDGKDVLSTTRQNRMIDSVTKYAAVITHILEEG